MNPTELRMMWMSQYNPERVQLEDAQPFFGHPSVGLSVMDEMPQQPIMDLNPMMSIVGGDFNSQAAAAAAALGVQPATLLAANTNNIYSYGTVNALQQQILQQTAAAAVFQNYAEMNEDEDGTGNGVADGGLISVNDQQQQVYNQIDDAYDDGSGAGGINGLIIPKQEIINIDDFVMMNDSNSYDEAEFMAATSSDQDITQTSSIIGMSTGNDIINGSIMDENELLVPLSGLNEHQQKLLTNFHNSGISVSSPTTTSPLLNSTGSNCGNTGDNSSGGGGVSSTGGNRAQRKTRKIEPVNRPGLVLKTPIAYRGNIDPSVIPIQKDGMAVCERCGAIGVKHTFYTKSRRFCSMACARGELYSLVVNNKISSGNQNTNSQVQQSSLLDNMDAINANNIHQQQLHSQTLDHNINMAGTKHDLTAGEQINNNSPHNIIDNSDESSTATTTSTIGTKMLAGNDSLTNQATKSVRLYHDVLPHDEVPQIPKYDRLPAPCPQLERVLTIKKRHIDPSYSFDWTPRLSRPDFYAAPVTCFPHTPGYEVWDNLDIDMKVEVENTDCDSQEVIQPGQTPHSFWVASILNISGYKALMRYEGFNDGSHDFWVNLCSSEVHAVGWCATRGKPLIPPKTLEKKYKDWKEFLVSRLSGARTLPSSFYNKINESLQSRFRLGLNLECVDKDRISQVRLATVTRIVGKRLFLRYFDSDDGFWCHEDSPIIHPVGWATTVGHNLAAPQDYLERMLAGREAMIEVHEDDATIELFKMNFTFEEYYGRSNGFVEGMKLEAVDPLNLSSICAATVMAVLKFGYMMIRIDSYSPDASGADWFCYHEKSPCIFPIGFCASNNIPLTPPNGYESHSFTWEKYLQDTGGVSAAPILFHNIIPEHGFQVGMSLECADLMDPRLVCVATIARVVGRLLKIHFDGWTDEYDQWLDCESPDIYPVGWCYLVNHKLEGPPAPTISQPAKVATTKTKVQKKRKKKIPNTPQAAGLAIQTATKTNARARNPNIKSFNQKTNIKVEEKPDNFISNAYYESNQNQNTILDDLDDEDVDEEFIADKNLQQPDKTAPLKSEPSIPIVTSSIQLEKLLSDTSKSMQRKVTSTTSGQQPVFRKQPKYTNNSTITNAKNIPRSIDKNNETNNEQQQHEQLSLTTNITNVATTSEAVSTISSPASSSTTTQNNNDLTPDVWNLQEVSQFLRANDCTVYCETFARNKIDGKRLMLLSKDEIINLLGMKVGPALKIYDLIQQLRCKVNPGGKSRMNKNNKTYL